MEKICKRCVMDTTDPTIRFDNKGYCNHCRQILLDYNMPPFSFSKQEKEIELQKIISSIKEEGIENKYDCLIGVSGGVDSTYVAYLVKMYGLRPLAIHLDNGWNSELAEHNIQNLINKLQIDFKRIKVDPAEFRDLQLAYLKASVVDLEVVSDNLIHVIFSRLCKKYKVKYFINGCNYATEAILPKPWIAECKYDGLNIRSIYKKFGSKKALITYPTFSFLEALAYTMKLSYMKQFAILNYVDYNKEKVKELIQKELGWVDYGGKHFESIITRFYQAYILPEKFNIDKRKAHYSSLICSNQLSRDIALKMLKEPLYEKDLFVNDKKFFLSQMGLTETEFTALMNLPIKEHTFYPSYTVVLKRLLKVGAFIKKKLRLRIKK